MPGGSGTTLTSKPCCTASAIPRRVADSPAASPPHEAGCAQLVDGEALRDRLAGQCVAAERNPEPELAADLFPEPAPLQVVAGEPSTFGLPERSLVVGRGLVEDREEALTAL